MFGFPASFSLLPRPLFQPIQLCKRTTMSLDIYSLPAWARMCFERQAFQPEQCLLVCHRCSTLRTANATGVGIQHVFSCFSDTSGQPSSHLPCNQGVRGSNGVFQWFGLVDCMFKLNHLFGTLACLGASGYDPILPEQLL